MMEGLSASSPCRVAPREWAWVGIAGLLVTVFFSLPYLMGWAHSTPEMAFGGMLFGLDDMHSYLAKMRYGARDGWLFRLVYTGEPHAGGFIYPHFLALGKLAALISGEGAHVSGRTLLIAYHAARVVCGLLLLLVTYRFAAEYLPRPSQRRLAWALAALAGGLGWIPLVLALVGRDPSAANLPVEFYVPEAFGVLSLYGLPHLALARTLLLGGWLLLFRAGESGRWQQALLAGALWGGMGLIVPFYAALLGVLIAAWLAVLGIVRLLLSAGRLRVVWEAGAVARLAALAAVLPALVLGYHVWLFASDPILAAWAAQNRLPSPPLADYALAYGLLIALAGVGLTREAPRLTQRTTLLVVWPTLALALAYAPINVQRRLLEGVIVPLSILATLGVWRLLGEKPQQGRLLGWRLRQMGLAALIVLCFPSTFLLVGGGVLTAARPTWPVFHPADEIAALRWLDEHAAPDSLVLATAASGNIIPAYAGVRVYVGHGPETIDSERKRQTAEAFFLGGMTDETRRALLREAGIDYVWIGPPERPPLCTTCFDAAALGLRLVYQGGEYAIYAVGDGSP